jgi:hypothetical protein
LFVLGTAVINNNNKFRTVSPRKPGPGGSRYELRSGWTAKERYQKRRIIL